MKTGLSPLLAFVVLLPAGSALALDGNGNSLSDVWEMYFEASGLTPAADADKDGWSNLNESLAGTDPLSGASWPRAEVVQTAGQATALVWPGVAGKRYEILSSTDLENWATMATNIPGSGGMNSRALGELGPQAYFKVQPSDVDSDADGVSDWEEGLVGFLPGTNRTGRFPETDLQRITAGLTAANIITVSVYDDACWERWPDPAVFVLRRSGGLQPLTVNFSLGGTATGGADYTPSASGSITFATGQREAFVKIMPVTDAEDGEVRRPSYLPRWQAAATRWAARFPRAPR